LQPLASRAELTVCEDTECEEFRVAASCTHKTEYYTANAQVISSVPAWSNLK